MSSLLDEKLKKFKKDKFFNLMYSIIELDYLADHHFYEPILNEIELLVEESPWLLNEADSEGYTPLMMALEKKHNLLVEQWVGSTEKLNQESLDGKRALDLAIKSQNKNWIQWLVENGCEVLPRHLENSQEEIRDFLSNKDKEGAYPFISFLRSRNIFFKKDNLFFRLDENILNLENFSQLVVSLGGGRGLIKFLDEWCSANKRIDWGAIWVIKNFLKISSDQNLLIHVLKKGNFSSYLEDFCLKDQRVLFNLVNDAPRDCFKKWIKKATPKDIVYLLAELNRDLTILSPILKEDIHPYHFDDLSSMKDVYDSLLLGQWYKDSRDYKLNPRVEFLALDDCLVGDLIIKIPKKASTLLVWGRRMNNCVADYAKKTAKGRTQVVGIFSKGRLKYNVEIKNKRIAQVEAPKGQKVLDKDLVLIEDFLKDKSIILTPGIGSEQYFDYLIILCVFIMVVCCSIFFF